MFTIHTVLEEFKNNTITSLQAMLVLHLGKTRSEKADEYCESIILQSSVFKMLSVHTKTKSGHFQIPLI